MTKKPEMRECDYCKGFGGYYWFFAENDDKKFKAALRNLACEEPKAGQEWATCAICSGAGFIKKTVDTSRDSVV